MTPVTRLGLIARSHPSASDALIEAAEWLSAHGATVVVQWTPDGLDIEINGKRSAWPLADAHALEYPFPARDEDGLCPMAVYEGPSR